jgi:hypothetical protein
VLLATIRDAGMSRRVIAELQLAHPGAIHQREPACAACHHAGRN